MATSTTPGGSEVFEIVRKSDDWNRVKIKAPNGSFLQVSEIGSFSEWLMTWILIKE